MPQADRRDHYVPQMWLKQFATPTTKHLKKKYRKVFVHRRPPAISEEKFIGEIAWSSYFYSPHEGPDPLDVKIEESFGRRFEGPGEPPLSSLVNGLNIAKHGDQMLVPNADREALARLFGLQCVRTGIAASWSLGQALLRWEEQRSDAMQSVGSLVDLLNQLSLRTDDSELRALADAVFNSNEDEQKRYMKRLAWLDWIQAEQPVVSQMIQKLTWQFVIPPKGFEFAIADYPLIHVAFGEGVASLDDGPEFDKAAALILPLSSNALVIVGREGSEATVHQADEGIWRNLTELTAFNAADEVYASRDLGEPLRSAMGRATIHDPVGQNDSQLTTTIAGHLSQLLNWLGLSIAAAN